MTYSRVETVTPPYELLTESEYCRRSGMSTFVMPRVAVSAPKIWNESLTKMVPLCFQVYVSGGVPPEIVAENTASEPKMLVDALGVPTVGRTPTVKLAGGVLVVEPARLVTTTV